MIKKLAKKSTMKPSLTMLRQEKNFSTKPKKFQGSFRVTNFAMNHQKELKLVALQ